MIAALLRHQARQSFAPIAIEPDLECFLRDLPAARAGDVVLLLHQLAQYRLQFPAGQLSAADQWAQHGQTEERDRIHFFPTQLR